MSLSQRVVRGAASVGVASYIQIVLAFGGNVILARLLLPEDFGVYTFAVALLTLVYMIGGFGSQEAITQLQKDNLPDLIPTAFWITVALNLALALISTGLGLLAARLLGPTVAHILIAVTWVRFVGTISGIYTALLQKEMRYTPLAVAAVSSTVVGIAAGVVPALLGWGAWALVMREVGLAGVTFGVLWYASRYWPPFAFNWKTARAIWDFGWQLMVTRITQVLFGELDNALVGGFLGAGPLGFYSLAYRFAVLGQQVAYTAVHNVVYSAFTAIQSEELQLREGFQRMGFWFWRVSVLAGLGTAAVGYDLVLLIYGNKWAQSAELFQALFLFTGAMPLLSYLSVFLIGIGMVRQLVGIRIAQLAFFLPALYLTTAVLGDLMLTVWAVNLTVALELVLLLRTAHRRTQTAFVRLAGLPILAGAATYVLVWLADVYLLGGLPFLLNVGLRTAATVGIFGAVLYLAEPDQFHEQLRYVTTRLFNRRHPRRS